jgi:cellobiose epimerase
MIRFVLAGLALAASLVIPQPAFAALTEAERLALQDLASRAGRELSGNILPFWITHVRDTEDGGFHGEVRADLSATRNAPRGALLTCRVLWTYSAEIRRNDKPEYRDMARWAYEDLLTRFWDKEHGGLYWTVKANGRPLQMHKQVYLQSFGIYALSEYHRATGDTAALEKAIEIYRRLETHARDPEHGGYFEAYSRDWSRELPEMRRTIGGTAPKSQNTHLHVMEAYANLQRAWDDPGLRASQNVLLNLMLTRVLDPKTSHLGLFFAADWTPASTGISYGHDIEAAWLLCDAATTLSDPALIERAREVAVKIAQVTLAEGVSPLGAVYNEAGPRGLTDPNHDWWPQAEAAVGFLNAYQISGDATYLRAAIASWDFIEKSIVDHKNGEWFRSANPEGKPFAHAPKANIWKCPYHNGRACMELVDRVNALLMRER